jgi:hypothetical protein
MEKNVGRGFFFGRDFFFSLTTNVGKCGRLSTITYKHHHLKKNFGDKCGRLSTITNTTICLEPLPCLPINLPMHANLS